MNNKNTEFENLINTLPVRIQLKKEVRCSCGAVHTETITYQLKLDVDIYYSGERNQISRPIYRLYYKCSNFSIGNSNRYIGVNAGLGFYTFKEAYEDLLRYLKREGIEINDKQK